MAESPLTATVELNGKHITLTEVKQGDGSILRFSGTEVKPDGRVMAFHDKRGKHGFATVPFTLEARPNGPTFQERLDKLGDGPGTEMLVLTHDMGMLDCSACWRLAGVMNKRGSAWCRSAAGMSYCVEDAIDRAVAFWDDDKNGVREKLTAWSKSPLSLWDAAKFAAILATDKEAGLRMLLERLFTEAIDRAEAKETAQ